MGAAAPNGDRQLVTLKEKSMTLKAILDERSLELRAALPRHLTPERLIRLVMTACTRNPQLLNCTDQSVYGAVLQCAQLGLEPDLLGQAYLVPYRNNKKGVFECQLIPGYKGLLTLARRSGEIASVEARVVRAGDIFDYQYGLEPKLLHKPEPSAKGELSHVYAIARLKHGLDPQWEVMTKEQVEKHRSRSRASGTGPWTTDYEAMCLKTVLRVLCKLLPASVELHTAVALDEAADAGLPQELPIASVDAAKGDAETQGHPPIDTDGVSVECACPDGPAGTHEEGCEHAA